MPAASIIDYVPYDSLKFFVDPNPNGLTDESFRVVKAPASEGIPIVVRQLRELMAGGGLRWNSYYRQCCLEKYRHALSYVTTALKGDKVC